VLTAEPDDVGDVTTYYVKIVSPSMQLQAAGISFTGVPSIDKTGTETALTGNPGTRNTLAAPGAIVPQASSVTVANGRRFAFRAGSVTVLQITAKWRRDCDCDGLLTAAGLRAWI
jgi:hypothetical protein